MVAEMTSEGFLAGMFQEMRVKTLFGDIAAVTHITDVGLVTSVSQQVSFHIPGPDHHRTEVALLERFSVAVGCGVQRGDQLPVVQYRRRAKERGRH